MSGAGSSGGVLCKEALPLVRLSAGDADTQRLFADGWYCAPAWKLRLMLSGTPSALINVFCSSGWTLPAALLHCPYWRLCAFGNGTSGPL